jgi:hypothetical protein
MKYVKEESRPKLGEKLDETKTELKCTHAKV